MKHVVSKGVEETKKLAQELVDSLVPQNGHATLVGLYGDLGSGKTTFIQYAAEEFGVTDMVTSPTFVIQKTYDISHPHFKKLFHIDAYRLDSGKELLALGWNETLSNSQNIIFMEWAGRVEDVLPEYTHKLSFAFVDENIRTIDIELYGSKN